MKVDVVNVRTMSRSELDELFHASPPGPIPTGRARGTAIVLPGTWVGRLLASLVRMFMWKGKIFRPERGDLRNRIGPFGIPAIRARVYVDQSWFAKGEAVILDYSQTSLLARMIRDEIRLVGPGVYLGVVYWGRRLVARFLLEFPRRGDDGE
jgi:hypothetical protein